MFAPDSRFPEFEDAWRPSSINDVCSEFQSGKGISSEDIFLDGLYPVYGGNGLRGFTDRYNHDGEYVLIGRQGALCGNVRFVSGKTYITEHAIAAKASKDNDTKFLHFMFERMKLGQYSDQSAQPGLAVNKLLRLKVNIPFFAEQHKIAEFLSLIDKRIATQSRAIEKLQSLMKGLNNYLQDHVEKEITLSFSEMGSDYSGLTGKTGDDFGSGKPYIPYINVYANTFIDERNLGRVFISEGERQPKVHKGDVVFTLSSETPEEVCYGSVYWGEENEIYLNSFCFGVHITNDKVFPPYLAYFVNSTPFRKAVFPLAQGSTRYNLQKSDFLKKPFALPSLENQKRIFLALNTIDKKIQTEQSIIESYRQQKSFLLNRMFI